MAGPAKALKAPAAEAAEAAAAPTQRAKQSLLVQVRAAVCCAGHMMYEQLLHA
jgi:hypothetical protein